MKKIYNFYLKYLKCAFNPDSATDRISLVLSVAISDFQPRSSADVVGAAQSDSFARWYYSQSNCHTHPSFPIPTDPLHQLSRRPCRNLHSPHPWSTLAPTIGSSPLPPWSHPVSSARRHYWTTTASLSHYRAIFTQPGSVSNSPP